MARYLMKSIVFATVAALLFVSLTSVDGDASTPVNEQYDLNLYDGVPYGSPLPDGCTWDYNNCILTFEKDATIKNANIFMDNGKTATVVVKKVLTLDSDSSADIGIANGNSGLKITGGGKIVSNNASLFAYTDLILENISLKINTSAFPVCETIATGAGSVIIKDCPLIELSVDASYYSSRYFIIKASSNLSVENSNLHISKTKNCDRDVYIKCVFGAITMSAPSGNLLFFTDDVETPEFISGVTTVICPVPSAEDSDLYVGSFPSNDTNNAPAVIGAIIILLMAISIVSYATRKKNP